MFEPLFMRLALAASVTVGLALGLIGVYLVIRRVVFFGLVLANAATLGAAIADVMSWPSEVVSLGTAVAAAAVLGGTGATNRMSAEALMGWAYASASATTVLILSWAASGSSDTLHLLFGNVLAVPATHVVWLAILSAAVVAVHLGFGRRFLLVTFDPDGAMVAGVHTRGWNLLLNLMISIAAAAAVHEIGALSTFSLLTLPAMAALWVTASIRTAFIVAGCLGMAVPALALAGAFYLDLPAGPAAVALLALCVGTAGVYSRLTG